LTGENDPKLRFYCSPEGDNLRQGDILQLDPALKEVLSLAPHLETSSHVVVITQCCDLVKERSKTDFVKADFIALAPTISLSMIVSIQLAKRQSPVARKQHVCASSKKQELQKFLRDLLNNNNHSFLYLCPEANFEIFDDLCALLRQPLTLRATPENYVKCLRSRVVSLDGLWRAKLGWQVGNIYSRVGTPEWSDVHMLNQKIETILSQECRWVNAEALQHAEQRVEAHPELSEPEGFRKLIEEIKVPSKVDKVVDLITAALNSINCNDDEINKVISDLKADMRFQRLIK
jgi:hypothetical protein